MVPSVLETFTLCNGARHKFQMLLKSSIHIYACIFVGKALPLQPDFGFGVKVLLLIWLR